MSFYLQVVKKKSLLHAISPEGEESAHQLA